MVLQGGEKHCNSCGATLLETRSRGHVLYRRQVKRTTETLNKKANRKKKIDRSSQVCHISFYIFYSLFVQYSLVLFWKKERKKNTHASAFQSLRSASFSMPAIRTHETSHMGGDVFVIQTLKSKAVWWAIFLSSVTQARIITVQLLARAAAAGKDGVGPFVGQVNQPSTAPSAGYSQSGANL